MFTTPCFIKKNTKELKSKLEDLGYHEFKYCRDEFENNDVLAVIEMDNGEPIYVYIAYQNLDNMGYIDCGTNEQLFLAIAALRDDSDMDQWFVSDEGTYRFSTDAIFNVGKANYINNYPTHWHKASIEELIEHFKDK